ncbi:MAG: ABC transporter ATP-binding protein [Clostridium argentinense]|uniref:ABC transporter ATP-binding protein n=1 Tax=Clostridium faecium TaxID=2762223 RepID=A0ABR8YU69_9CLOT|nr:MULTISPECIES: ABC transporter ATP-binding protein [Clostridium]MBD8047790.1 ABC transporter ATP-binding protein [Clostridium faecium]MBS5823869.1 ABC transporter ATP-binding protein [Clostridium argentinense]MDU1350411.1 ABC transporter ATP-binding protein [Clostridium argentinense]
MRNNKTLRTVFSMLKWTIVLSILNSIFLQFIEFFIVNTIGDFTDSILRRDSIFIKEKLWLLALALVMVMVIAPLLRYMKNKSLLTNSLTHDEYIFGKVIRQKLKYLKSFNEGELHYRIQDDPIDLRCYINFAVTGIVTLILVILGAIFIMGNIRWDMAILTIILSLFSVIGPIITRKIQGKLYKNNKAVEGHIVNLERNAVENMAYIKAESLEKDIYETYEGDLNKLYNTIKATIRLESLIASVNKFISLLCELMIYIVISYYISKTYITVGEAVKFLGIYGILKNNFSQIESYIKQATLAMVSKDRVYELICDEELMRTKIVDSIDKICVSNLTFGYGDKKVLNNISFNINNGDKLLIMGDNGTGKTTFIRVLMGLYDDYHGEIFINEIELRDINKDCLRDKISVVSQNPYIINDSLYNNLTLGREDISEDHVRKVIKELKLEDIVEKDLGENGAHISGGQRQKISLGRAFLRKSNVVILDEPTSFLDREAMDKVMRRIKELDSTCIVISHEANLKEVFNNIYTFERA